MKSDISDKKVRVYTILLFMLLLLAEIYLNLFTYITNYSKGKLSITFFAEIEKILTLIRFDIFLYVVLLFLIYLAFGFINAKYILLVSEASSKKRFLQRTSIKGFLFILINGYFILTLYLLNYASYPFSTVTRFGSVLFPQENHTSLYYLFLIMMGIYFLALACIYLRYAAKRAKIITLGFLGILLVANLHPAFYVQKIIGSLNRQSINEGPNVIIIGLDSLNPKHTGYFGYPYDTTPNLDMFLEQNIVFKDCYTPLARTTASWFSILTGSYPKNTGIRYNLINRRFANPDVSTLPNTLQKEKGYFTAFFTDETRFCNLKHEDGFQYMRHPIIGVKDFIFGSIHDFSLTNVFFNNPLGYKIFKFSDINRAVYHLYRHKYFSNELTAFVPKLKKKERFFLVTHFCAPHWPYLSPAPYPFIFRDENNLQFSSYDGTLRMVDEQLGHLLKALKKNGIYDNSFIIILSDHGETLYGHGTNLRDPAQNRILLTIKPPRSTRHLDVEHLVRSIDITPTIMDVFNLPANSHQPDGLSLMPLINGSDDPVHTDRAVIMETGFSVDVPGGVGLAFQEMINEGLTFYVFDQNGRITVKEELHDELVKRKQRAILTKDWKLVIDPILRKDKQKETVSLYYLKDDPACINNVSDKYPDVFERMYKQMAELYKEEIVR